MNVTTTPWNKVSQILGYDSLLCMQSKDYTEILKATSQLPSSATTPNFQPTVDGKFIFAANYTPLSQYGSFAKVVSTSLLS
jgi:hypothetical protein